MQVIDLSQEISRQTQVFPTYPSPYFILWTKRETYGFEAEVMMMAVHTGTHVDAPYHFTPHGVSISDVAPDSLMGEAVVVDVSWVAGRQLITLPTFIEALGKSGVELRVGDIVLVRTGWDRHLGTERYITDYPGLAAEVARYLASRGVKVLGVDTPNPDHPDDGSFPVHNTLLPREILIIENLTGLERIPSQRLRFIGLPLKLKGLSGSPIRAVVVSP
ncbi:MAG: cyclase family protein [Nitrososphaerota archaeon]